MTIYIYVSGYLSIYELFYSELFYRSFYALSCFLCCEKKEKMHLGQCMFNNDDLILSLWYSSSGPSTISVYGSIQLPVCVSQGVFSNVYLFVNLSVIRIYLATFTCFLLVRWLTRTSSSTDRPAASRARWVAAFLGASSLVSQHRPLLVNLSPDSRYMQFRSNLSPMFLTYLGFVFSVIKYPGAAEVM